MGITAVMCEMLRAYTVKSTRPAHETFFRNRTMHFACFISFFFTVSLTLIPGVKEIFKLDTPQWFFYCIAFAFAFGCALSDEIFKFFYRIQLRKRKMEYSDSRNLQENHAMLDQLESGRKNTDKEVYDVKESLG